MKRIFESHARIMAAVACVGWGVMGTMAQAQETAGSVTVPVVSKLLHVQHEVAADGRSTTTYQSIQQVLKPNAVERMKSSSFSYSNSIQKGEVVEAYTLKADGRKIPVPSTNYQTEVSDGRNGSQPFFSDRSRITVVFPDLAVGDSVQLTYRIEDKEPIFPGAFSVVQRFSPYGIHEDSRITIKAAKGLDLRYEAHDLVEDAAREEGDFRIRSWSYKNTVPRTWNEADAGVWRVDESPSLLVSTFPSYEAIAQAYGDRALPKAQPTPRIRELAQTIVGDATEPRARARRLYEWVSTQITYGGNCIGVGAVVPRDVDVVLDNKMGDCKDHATLLQALLAAVDVRSEQVLINAGDVYDLPATPVVSMVNHVINYLPDFDMYLDATAKQVPFGLLPQGTHAKPVIHVGAPKALAQVPAGSSEHKQQRVQTSLRIESDGKASGRLQASFKGTLAADMREYMRSLQGESEREFVRKALAGNGFKARGVLDKGDVSDAKALSDEYSFSFTFDIDNYLQSGARGAFSLEPVIHLPLAVGRMAREGENVLPNRRVTCYGYRSHESYDIELAPGVSFVHVPAALNTRHKHMHYAETFQKTKTGYQIEREVRDETPEGLCDVEYSAQWNTEAKAIAEHLQQQVFYQRAVAPKAKEKTRAKAKRR